jgi:tetratricopeptide (TPR) repeat protein
MAKRSSKTRVEEETAPAASGRGRRRRTPPPLSDGSERFEGGDILAEVEGELGGLLWNSLRNATVWARATDEARAAMAVPEAAVLRAADLESIAPPGAIRAPLEAIAATLDRPAEVTAGEISAACRSISEWASAQGFKATAVDFMQAAALAMPSDASLAVTVGRLARWRAEYPRAESWFLFAVSESRRNGDWTSYARAFIGLGNLYGERGNLPAAKRAATQALRAAKRHSLREQEGMALHDLFVFAAHVNRVREADEYAAAAARVYGEGHPRLPRLAHDLAYLWLERGYHADALPIFLALRPHTTGHREKFMLLSSIVRSAAGAGETELFEETWEQAVAAIADTGEAVAAAWLNMAYGAELAGDMERAEGAARKAFEVAEKTREGKLRLTAEALLERVTAGPREEEAERRPVRHVRGEDTAEEIVALLEMGVG